VNNYVPAARVNFAYTHTKCVLFDQQACAIETKLYCMSYKYSSHSHSYLSVCCVDSICMTCKSCEIKDMQFWGFKNPQKPVTVFDSLPYRLFNTLHCLKWPEYMQWFGSYLYSHLLVISVHYPDIHPSLFLVTILAAVINFICPGGLLLRTQVSYCKVSRFDHLEHCYQYCKIKIL